MDAVNLLRKYNIDVVAHIMVGLPGECEKVSILDNPNDVCLSKLRNNDVLNNYIVYPNWAYKNLISTVNFINELDIQGLKIHSTYVVNGTKLCGLFEKGKYIPISLEDYLDSLCFIITHIRSDIVIHRLSADAPRNLLVAPDWNSHKKWVINGIDKLLNDKSLYQGMYYKD